MSQSKYWCITSFCSIHIQLDYWDTWYADNAHLIEWIIGQVERCPKTGKLHFQGFVALKSRMRFAQVQDIFGSTSRVHLERMRGQVKDQRAYCHKESSRVPESDGGWRMEYGAEPESSQGKRSDLEMIRDLVKDGKTNLEIIDIVPGALRYVKEMDYYRRARSELEEKKTEEIELRGWQLQVLEILKQEPVTRRILWIWSPHSGVGKTTFLRYLMAKRVISAAIGDKNLSNFMMAYNGEPVIWFDFSRSDPLDATATDVLEKLSNGGYAFSGKYNSCKKWVSAHIVVTTNREPPRDRLPKRILSWQIHLDGESFIYRDRDPEIGDQDIEHVDVDM